MSDQNKAIVRRYLQQVWDGGNLTAADELLDNNYLCYEPGQAPLDRERTKGNVSAWRSAFPDLRTTIEDAVAEGDTVALRITINGTQQGQLGDLPPSGNRIDLPGAVLFRVRNGKITEERDFYDQATFLQQLQAKSEATHAMHH